jgi:hypothetical protein
VEANSGNSWLGVGAALSAHLLWGCCLSRACGDFYPIGYDRYLLSFPKIEGPGMGPIQPSQAQHGPARAESALLRLIFGIVPSQGLPVSAAVIPFFSGDFDAMALVAFPLASL